METVKGYVSAAYLQAISAQLAEIKKRSYSLMHIRPGHKVLDVGCGPGMDTIPLVEWVGPTGQVFGVDYDETLITAAEQRANSVGVATQVFHRKSLSDALPFESDTVDASRSDRLFQHLADPAPTLREMLRVTKPGGWIVVLDTDWGTISIDTKEVDVERRLATFLAEQSLNNGYSGRQLYRLFRNQLLTEVTYELFPLTNTNYSFAREAIGLDRVEQDAIRAGIISQPDLDRWHASLERAEAEGTFFGSVSMMMVAGRKPGPLK